MRVTCEWLIELPYRFAKSEDYKFKDVKIDEVSIIPISLNNKNYYNGLQVKYLAEMPDEIIPKDEYEYHKTLEFKINISKKVGYAINIFNAQLNELLNNFSIGNLFNGEDFTTGYVMRIYNDINIPFDGLDAMNSIPVLTQVSYESLLQKINNPYHPLENQFIKLANLFLENGYLDMAIMNLSMSLESLIKKLVFSGGISPQDLDKAKGYVDKFFHFGLKKVKGFSLLEYNENLFSCIKVITDLRNHVAHGNSLRYYPTFKDWTDEEVFSFIEDLIWNGEDIIDLIKS